MNIGCSFKFIFLEEKHMREFKKIEINRLVK